MAYNIKLTTTKPAGTLWFYESGTPNAMQILQNIDAWDASQPGFISSTGIHIGDNVYEHTIIFDSSLNGDAWLLALQTQMDHMERDAYLHALPVEQTTLIT
jgi:hypothetical protein